MGKIVQFVILLVLIAFASATCPLRAQALGDALRPGETLNERAKSAGGKFLWRYRANRAVIYPNIEALAKHSDVIVVGRTIGHRAHVRSDGRFITKDFSVRVQEVIKGNVKMGSSIVVSLPGGAYKFPDGSVAFVMPTGYQQAEDRGLYVFFLKEKGSLYQGHTPTSETQALFDLTSGKVQPADLVASDPIVSKYREMSVPAFLAEIHKATPLKSVPRPLNTKAR